MLKEFKKIVVGHISSYISTWSSAACQTFVIAYTEVSATVSLYHLLLSYEDPESPKTSCHVEQIKHG